MTTICSMRARPSVAWPCGEEAQPARSAAADARISLMLIQHSLFMMVDLKKKPLRRGVRAGTNHDHALIVVVAIPFVTDLSPDFAPGKHWRVDIGVPQVDAQNPHEAGEVAGRDVLRGHGQDVGRGPRAGDRAAMPGSVRARGPASPAAEEHDHRASILRLPEVDVRRLRRGGQLAPRQSPRDAGAVGAQRAGKLALAVD